MVEVISLDPPEDGPPVSWNPDRGGARVLFTISERYYIPVTFRNSGVGPFANETYQIDITDSRGNTTGVYRRSPFGGAADEAKDAIWDAESGEEVTVEFWHQDDNSILTQYDDGVWDPIAPGEITYTARLYSPLAGEGSGSSASAPSRWDLDPDAPVKENARFRDVQVGGLAPGSPVGSAAVTFENPAFHGINVSYTLRVTGQSEYVTKTFSDTLNGTTTRSRGAETTQVDLGSFTLPDSALLGGETITVAVEPAAPYLAPASAAVQLPDPSEWVRPSCSRLPDQVVEGETFDAGATIQNTGSVDVPITYTVRAGDESASGSLTVPADGAEPATEAFETVEPGELPVEFDWLPDV